MALLLKDRVKETTTTTGTGDITLGGAISGFQSFGSVLSNSDTTYYAISHRDSDEWEVGLGTYDSTAGTIARTTVLESSNSGSAVSFTSGTKDIFITLPAEKAVTLDSNDVLSVGNITTSGYLRGPSTFTIDPAAHGDNTGTLVVAGNLQVDGTTTTINSTTVSVEDLNLTLASGAATAAAANGAGITVDGAAATITYDSVNDRWTMNKDLAANVVGNITGTASSLSNHTTTDLAEGTNLYYTTARFDTAFTGKTTSDLTEGTNLYYTAGRFDTDFSAKNTSDLSEGTNLYYTTTRANTDIDARVTKSFVDALNIDANTLGGNQASDYYLATNPNGYTTNTGTVTSVSATVPTGFSVTGSPVTTSGTLAVAYDTGYQGYTTAEATKLSGIEPNATADQTASEILTAIKTVDGTGSGLDADTLDGLNSTDFATAAQGTKADTAYGWGDHASAGYLTSYTETDPVYTASSWYTTTNNSTNWDTAYGWGDHASAGYLTSITGQSITSLSDVFTSMSPADGQVLTYDTTNGWQAETPAAGGVSEETVLALAIAL